MAMRRGNRIMSFFDTLQDATRQERHELFNLPIIVDALEGKVSLESYQAFLTQAYYHVRHTVPLMMACGARLPQRLEWLRKAVCEYIEDEYGHEQWVLNDIQACGGDPDAVRDGRPSLPIELMVSFLYDLIARDNPVGLFGMVNVLEGTSIALATHAATSIRDRLKLPQSAFSYLSSHGSLDIEHMQTYRQLMNKLHDPDDQAAVIHASKVVYRLYTEMFRGLPRNGEKLHASV
jgi:thiaminase